MDNPEQLISISHLIKALADANYWSKNVPHSSVRELNPAQVSDLCNALKDLYHYSKSVRTLAFEEGLFENAEETGGA